MTAGSKHVLLILFLILGLIRAQGQQTHTLTARVDVSGSPKTSVGQSHIVVWLSPLGVAGRISSPAPAQHPQLVQKNKSFEPHLLVVPVGSVVEFPNRDPFFHNVFSLFDGKRFDLGLYEAGTTRFVHFDKPGICYIFCNIHSEMSAVVVVLDTPYHGIANNSGAVTIQGVPPGHYMMHVWDERALPQSLAKLAREVVINENSSLGTIRVAETDLPMAHKNKYGRAYDRPTPSSPIYVQP
jgi:plastocyanin